MARRRTHTHVQIPTAALALALTATACGVGTGGAPAADPLVVWIMEGTNPDATTYFEAANTAFTERTGVEVEVEFVPWSDAQNKISTAIAGGTVPDVVELGTTFIPEFADSGALYDLSAHIDDPYLYTQSMVRMGQIEDRIYGVPWYAAIRSIVYRTDLFEEHGQEVPEDWAELRETAIALSEAEEDMIAFPVPGDAQYSVMPWIWGGGGELAVRGPDGTWESEIDSEGGRAGMSFFTGLALEDGVSTTGAVNWNEIDVMEALAEERAVMAISGSANPKAILESNPGLEGRLGAFPIPGREGGYTDSFAGGSLLSVFAGTGQEETAWEYVAHLTGDEFSIRWSEETGFFPGRAAAVRTFAESENPLVRPFAVQLEAASRGTPVTPAWGRVEAEKVIVAMQQDILNGDASVEEATEHAADEIERILNGD
ncbi:sugar ABC transporter substrate-binding protein [Nocardiopsis sp. NPDC050513]|uniref:sugar ABC transporter substrate-binding protein n=1 Tax=Nocardiopsis sp. NPDC050513 TaxID=3364338 RepID=UPI0037B6E8F9